MSVPLREWLESVPWLHGLPRDWQVARFKSIASLSTTDNSSHDDRLLSLSTSRGIVPKHYDDENRIRSGEDLQRYWTVRPGHVVVNPMWLAHGSVAASGIEGVISPDYRVYNPRPFIDSGYLALLLRTLEYRRLYDLFVRGDTTYDRRVSKDDFHSIPVVIPPLERQQMVARYLDRKTAGIDALVSEKERLIELLLETRKALITEVVTKGLDPNAKKKASGVDWLGPIPAHWIVQDMRHRIRRIEQGWSPSCETREADEGEWGVLKVGCVNYGGFRESENKALPSDLKPLPEFEVRPGDVLVSRANTRELVGSAAYVDTVRPRLLLCDKLFRIHCRPAEVDARFLVLLLQSDICRYQFEREATGASGSMQNIGQDTVRRLRFGWPPLDEQQDIVARVGARTSRIDVLKSEVQAHVERLREYRDALVTAAVTGKIDVTKEAA